MPTKVSTLKEKITKRWVFQAVECPRRKKGWEHTVFCIKACDFYRGKRTKILENVLCAYDGNKKNEEKELRND